MLDTLRLSSYFLSFSFLESYSPVWLCEFWQMQLIFFRWFHCFEPWAEAQILQKHHTNHRIRVLIIKMVWNLVLILSEEWLLLRNIQGIFFLFLMVLISLQASSLNGLLVVMYPYPEIVILRGSSFIDASVTFHTRGMSYLCSAPPRSWTGVK